MPIQRDGHFVTVQQHILEAQRAHPEATGQFSWLLSGITLATKVIGSYVRRAGLVNVWGEAGEGGEQNVQGETVQKLDVLANETLKKTLGYRHNVGIIASEEDNEPRVLREIESGSEPSYVVMFDPLDGSSNIDVNAPIGTIFTVFRNPEGEDVAHSVLQPGRKQVAAGYVVYGSSTVMVLAIGHGVNMFTLDAQFGAFLLTKENITIPESRPEYSINEAYYHRFPEPYREYLDWAKDRREGHGGSGGLTMRYIGSLVADFHRILLRGGVYLYPPTDMQPQGKLRLMYEANPLAFIAEAAGGAASDGTQRILDIQPTDVHDRTPLLIGSRDNVAEVERFVAKTR